MILRTISLHQTALPATTFNNINVHFVSFKHPAYPDGANTLLRLQATDSSPGGGLHHETARIACAIIACNAWDGYFSRTRDGPQVAEDPDDVLKEKIYYFQVPTPGSPEPYPICPSFYDWQFPHGDLPPSWSARSDAFAQREYDNVEPARPSTFSAAVLRRDGRCVMSGYGDGVVTAHLCPRSEAAWYSRNGMTDYNLNRMLPRDVCIDDMSNGLVLRSDIHVMFDTPAFVIVPKQGEWVAHFLITTRDLGRLYHNATVQLAPSVSTEALLTRFAWSIFPAAWIAQSGSGTRRLRVCMEESQGPVYTVQDMNIDKFLNVASSRSRSRSPKRRVIEGTTSTALEPSLPGGSSNLKRLAGGSQSDRAHIRQRTLLEIDGADGHRHIQTAANGLKLAASSTSPSTTTLSLISENTLLDAGVKTSETRELPLSPTSLVNFHSTSAAFETSSEVDTVVAATEPEVDYEKLKRHLLLKQRPLDPSLYCCNYPAIEADIRAGRPGKREYDGGYFCSECLGVEYIEVAEKEDDIDEYDAETHDL